jgi:hypothetical protein
MRGKYSVSKSQTPLRNILLSKPAYSIITDLLRDINDPEHPMSLEELNVVQITNIEVKYLIIIFHKIITLTANFSTFCVWIGG